MKKEIYIDGVTVEVSVPTACPVRQYVYGLGRYRCDHPTADEKPGWCEHGHQFPEDCPLRKFDSSSLG